MHEVLHPSLRKLHKSLILILSRSFSEVLFRYVKYATDAHLDVTLTTGEESTFVLQKFRMTACHLLIG